MLPNAVQHATVTPLGDELLVYDAKTQQAHCLNKLGMEVFQACQRGSSREDALVHLASLQLETPEAALEETLALLAEKGLVEVQGSKSFDRRRFLAAAGAAAALPVVASVLAPHPTQAVSCVDCEVNASLQPISCATCGNNCPATGCGSTSRCCFEYRVNSNNPEGAGACSGSTGGTGGQEGIGIYSCRAIPAGSFFNTDCDTARAQTIADAGGLVAANTRLYYCCRCPGNNPLFTCP